MSEQSKEQAARDILKRSGHPDADTLPADELAKLVHVLDVDDAAILDYLLATAGTPEGT